MAELNPSPEKTGRVKRNRAAVRVDLTAMVDLAFLLITFFMLTTTLAKNNMIPIAMPDKEPSINGAVPLSRTLTLCLGANNKVLSYMGIPNSPVSEPVVSGFDKNGLRKTLIAQRDKIRAKTGKDMILLLKPSVHSIYNNLVSAIDELNIAGVNRYAIVDISPADVELLKKYKSY